MFSMMFPARKHPLRPLTPASLARAIAWPFVIVVGGATAMLALAAATVGLNPIAFAGDFLTDAAVVLSPLAMKLLAIWAIYTTLYLVLAWDARFYAPRHNAGVNSELHALVGLLLRWRVKPTIVMHWQRCQRVKYRLDPAILFSAWTPGTHPQTE